jgi:protein subunit release factor B
MTEWGVSADKLQALRAQMRRLKIFEKDLQERFMRSSGPGGQNLNKVATCVELTHLPSHMRIKCQKERTQGYNRYWARVLLVAKIEQHIRQQELSLQDQREKQRRQNRARPLSLKENIREEKCRTSLRKEQRRRMDLRKMDDF